MARDQSGWTTRRKRPRCRNKLSDSGCFRRFVDLFVYAKVGLLVGVELPVQRVQGGDSDPLECFPPVVFCCWTITGGLGDEKNDSPGPCPFRICRVAGRDCWSPHSASWASQRAPSSSRRRACLSEWKGEKHVEAEDMDERLLIQRLFTRCEHGGESWRFTFHGEYRQGLIKGRHGSGSNNMGVGRRISVAAKGRRVSELLQLDIVLMLVWYLRTPTLCVHPNYKLFPHSFSRFQSHRRWIRLHPTQPTPKVRRRKRVNAIKINIQRNSFFHGS